MGTGALSGANVMVTGYRGYIGQVLTRDLLAEGCRVTGVDTDYFRPTPSISDAGGRLKEVIKDIRNLSKKDMAGIDAIIHLAAISDDNSAALIPLAAESINLQGTASLARTARIGGVKRFIFSSTSGVYGNPPDGMLCTEKSPVSPRSAYTMSKLAAENDLLQMASGSFAPVIMRNGTVYGYSPRPRFDSPANNFLYNAVTMKRITIKSDGLAWRPLINVSDLAKAFALALAAPDSDVSSEIFNIGGTRITGGDKVITNFRLLTIAREVQAAVPDCDVSAGKFPTYASYAMDTTKAASVLGFKPLYSLRDGFLEMASGYRGLPVMVDDFYSNAFWMAGLIGSGQINPQTFYWNDQ